MCVYHSVIYCVFLGVCQGQKKFDKAVFQMGPTYLNPDHGGNIMDNFQIYLGLHPVGLSSVFAQCQSRTDIRLELAL